MSEEFADLRRIDTPSVFADPAAGAGVSVTLGRWPNRFWEQLLADEAAKEAADGAARSVRLVPRRPGVPVRPMVQFTVAADGDLETAVRDVDALIGRVNARYRTEVVPRLAAAAVEHRTDDERLRERQTALAARAAQLPPPA